MAFGDSAGNEAGKVVGGCVGIVILTGVLIVAMLGFKGCATAVHCPQCNNSRKCPACQGSGRDMYIFKCTSCSGSGRCSLCK